MIHNARVPVASSHGFAPIAKTVCRRTPRPWLVLLALLHASTACASAAGDAARSTSRVDGVELHRGARVMQVVAITDDIIRVRVGADGTLPEDASWAVPDAMRSARVAVRPLANASLAGFRTRSLKVHINPATLKLSVLDALGHVVSQDADRAATFDGAAFAVHKALPEGEHIYALGDKTGPLDRRGRSVVDWNTDVGRFSETTDPLYKAIPFFIGVGGGGGAYGVFLDNTWRTWFDFGQRERDTLSFGADGGPIDYYLIHGPSLREVVTRYTALTGRPPLPPLWSLGYQQSRYGYLSAGEVRGVAARLRRERIPTDVLWLDIDFQDRKRPFTTDPATFADLPALAADMHATGVRLVAITDLHVARAPGEDYAPYDSGVAGDHFVKAADGSTFVGDVWPGPSVFPDFTRQSTRDWFGGLYAGFLDAGIAGFWDDMNEPALFATATRTMPLDVRHRIDTPGFAARTASHAEIHNVYGMQDSRATFDGVRRLRPAARAFVMTRATYAGGQRYAVTWTGDNSSTWSHLKLSVAQVLNLGLSGFAYSAVDVGGFTGGASPELMTRWFQVAAFMPLLRNHSAIDAPRAEPWVDGPVHTAIRRRFIEARYRLLPYFYALADENARDGAPLMRPLSFEFAEATTLPCDQSMTFLLGRSLLVAASPTPESSQPYKACLPAGAWYDFWTGRRVPGTTSGASTTLTLQPTLESLPVFVRGGSIVPRQPLVQTTQVVPQGPLTLDVYPGDDCIGTLYDDDGHSMGYTQGVFRRQRVRCRVNAAGLEITFDAPQGRYVPWWTQVDMVVHDARELAHVDIEGTIDARAVRDEATDTLRFRMPAPSRAVRIALRKADTGAAAR